MKAFLREDIITSLSPDGDTEIGQIPRDVGLERLRFNGQRVVDLATLDSMWVRPMAGGFELHAIEVPGSQLVRMRYRDRKRLQVIGGRISLKSSEQIAAELDKQRRALIVAQTKRKLEASVGPAELRLEYLAAIVTIIIEHVLNSTFASTELLSDILPLMKTAYPVDRLAARVKSAVSKSSEHLNDLWSKL